MFDRLSGKLSGVFDGLSKRGSLSEEDVNEAMREIRLAMLDADVALPVVKDFVKRVQEKSVGQEVLHNISPGQAIAKIVNDALIESLGGAGSVPLNLNAAPPIPYLMVGLQGSGKTTTSAKIAYYLNRRERKKVLLASLDTYRPAAQLQLEQLANQINVKSLPVIDGQMPVQIAKRAMEVGRLEGYDIVILDTAGRLSIDETLMKEVEDIRDTVKPVETLLVVDAMTGQDAVNTAKSFNEKVGISGVVMTRMDGDARGGAALSMRAITGSPIKLVGMGEKVDALQEFFPERVASRILGLGDIAGLVEKASETIDQEESERLAKKMLKGKFDLNDYAAQISQINKMGSISNIMDMLPGMGKMKDKLGDKELDTSVLKRHQAIISSMTKAERKQPAIIKASRKKRIALGSGTTVQEVNRLLKQYDQMASMMKRFNKLGVKGLMRQGLSALLPKGMTPPPGGGMMR
ncbi:signal recognition particle protein [Commensalibacter oyaizuii]|uniref:Signal recognition particle protein n=1 Tax=Commensalibacter oyaizuii TaxID=3043873 RepID=A0ABT6PZZ1_9PROT|nr:signal recognition particle protein [Commensalibacter sp. TBRC 16381]MDI2090432.1 signal recognition particle protein [Commensalibacter sp. TBRC 16381]